MGLLRIPKRGQARSLQKSDSSMGGFSYHAIDKGGYIALLSPITVFIVVGHGDNPLSDGLWRTVDTLIDIVSALAFFFALPLYAVYSWRYILAGALRDCAAIYSRIISGQSVSDDEHLKLLNRLNAATTCAEVGGGRKARTHYSAGG